MTKTQPVVTIYTTSTCGPCVRLKRALDEHSLAYAEINVETDAAAAGWVVSVNGGTRTVPTLLFADGSTLTNPTIDQVLDRVALTRRD